MTVLLTISMLINLAVLGLVVPAIWRNTPAMVLAYGPPTPARDIVLAFYVAIFTVSVVVLGAVASGQDWAGAAALTVLPVQIAYKALSAFTVGPRNPVVQANLVIAAFHAITLASLIY
ncbi:hypothetical protein QTO30_17095 [Yoonia sp. GPGPB17]|uniref:hypothetical protein n=1 Tax=Yoonia sp. GPGPB17 TaxID=3026147 RepID=UPI0030BB35C2